jgi:antitoxin component YwqK of YwqJK toxin-antitoxin module
LRLIILCAAVVTTNSALAQKKYDPGVTDTEIKIGNIMPYSGPASAYGMNGKVQAAYFKKAASMAEKSTSFLMTMLIARRKR